MIGELLETFDLISAVEFQEVIQRRFLNRIAVLHADALDRVVERERAQAFRQALRQNNRQCSLLIGASEAGKIGIGVSDKSLSISKIWANGTEMLSIITSRSR